MTHHVVMFSGGVGSWAAAKRVVARYGASDVILLFADTRIEDEDLYRFLPEASANVGAPLIRIADGRTPWQVFRDERFLGNSARAPCSKILKQRVCDRWLAENRDPEKTTVHVGIDWTEMHRFDNGLGRGIRPRRATQGWRYEAPLCEAPFITKPDMLRALAAEGIQPPRLYELGFSHNNCGGFCCKAGQGHFAHLFRTLPKRYREHEAQEDDIRKHLKADVSMMTDRSGGGVKKPLTLRRLRERIEGNGQVDLFEIGGCGCFVDAEEDDQPLVTAGATQ